MNPLKLAMPVYAADKSLLLAAGTILSPEVMADLAARGWKVRQPGLPVFEYGRLKEDFLEFIKLPPYQRIFADPASVDEILKALGGVLLPEPVLHILSCFKQHDFYTYRHMLLVAGLSMLLARELFPGDQEWRIMAGPVHDIGKFAVSRDILAKSEPLTRDERLILKQHTLAGHALLVYYLGRVDGFFVRFARDHHETRSGTGYPLGVRQIDLRVEIVAACDMYDGLISPRPFRPRPHDNRSALEEITAMAERKEIGWDVVRTLVAVNRQDKPHYTELKLSDEKRGLPTRTRLFGRIVGD